jgi:hypothetical protein
VEIFLLGRVFTYMLNAVIDAQLAEAILCDLRGLPPPLASPEVLARAEEFVRAADHHADREAHLLILAYTLERVNGRADYLTAGIFQHRVLGKHRHTVDEFVAEHIQHLGDVSLPYQEDHFQPGVVLDIGTDLLRGNFQDVEQFAARHGLTVPLDGRHIAAGVRHVQLLNIRFNKRVAHLLLSGADSHLPKVHAVRQAAQATPFPRLFVGASALTQRAAARWDRAFAMLLRARFRI